MSFLARATAITSRTSSHSVLARSLSTTAALRKDYVQDLYLRELKGYKPPPAAANAHVGSVKAFHAIPKPAPPPLPTDLATDLAKYESSEPTLTGPITAGGIAAAVSAEEGGSTPQEFLAFLEADLPKEDLHHGH